MRLLRGFLSGSRWMTLAVSSVVSLLLAGAGLGAVVVDRCRDACVPLYLGCLTLPAFVVANTQDGIARSHDWMRLGLMPQFIVRQSADHRLHRRRRSCSASSSARSPRWRRAAPRCGSR